MKRFFVLAAMALTMFWVFTACTPEADLTQPSDPANLELSERPAVAATTSGNTIVDIAVSNPDFSILVNAVVRAGLVDALAAPGNLTVFAPTNTAFTNFLDNAGINDVNDVPVATLRTILLTHVLNGEFFAANLSTRYFKTLATGPNNRPTDIFINTMNGVSINGSVGVVTPNIDASNGVIHVVNAVIAPSTIITLGASNPAFSTLVAALTRPDLPTDFIGALSGNGPFTVLAPTNAAFQNLLNSNPAWNSLADIPAATLDAVLKYHVTTGNLTSNFLLRSGTYNTLLPGATWSTRAVTSGGGVTVRIQAGSNSARVVAADVQAQNGVIHAIDTVILP